MGYCTWAGMNEANQIYHDPCVAEEKLEELRRFGASLK